MPSQNSSYLFAELTAASTFLLFFYDRIPWKEMCERRLMQRLVALFAFWLLVEQAAIALNVWSFSGNGVIGLRFLQLPIEEYIFIFLHIVFCATLYRIFSPRE